MPFEHVVWEMAAILSRGGWVISRILQACFTGIVVAMWSSHCQWRILKTIDKIIWYLTTTKHYKMWTMFLIFQMYSTVLKNVIY